MIDNTQNRSGKILQGRYRVGEQIADGAMGSVYRGERLGLGRKVAIKFLHDTHAGQTQFLKRFEREALAMSRLNHPNCVSVLDYGISDHSPYIVLDYVVGTTLNKVIEHGPIPAERAINIILQVLAGLAHAHHHGIVHRDIKPANVMLSQATGAGEHVHLLDFGLATLRDSGPTGDISVCGVVMGTPSYISPEQSLGEEVDVRSDIYSVGVLLFELLTGEKLFAAEDAFETLRMQREDSPPRLADVAPDLHFPPGLQEVLDRALLKDPNKRYQSATELAAALRPMVLAPRKSVASALDLALGDTQLDVRLDATQTTRPSSRLPMALGLIGVVLIGAAAAALWHQRKAATFAAEERAGPPAPAASPTQVAPTRRTGPAHGSASEAAPEGPGRVATAGRAEEFSGEQKAEREDHGQTTGPDHAVTEVRGIVRAPESGSLAPAEEVTEGDIAAAEDQVSDDELAAAEEEAASREVAAAAAAKTEPPTAPAAGGGREPKRPARTLADAKALAAKGHREEAIAGLQELWRKNHKSAYIPYLLGNLYFEKNWWSTGMLHYERAIGNNREYRSRPILNRNVIRALGAQKSKGKAISLVLHQIGRSALPYLRKAAESDPNASVKRRAAWLVDQLAPPKPPAKAVKKAAKARPAKAKKKVERKKRPAAKTKAQRASKEKKPAKARRSKR